MDITADVSTTAGDIHLYDYNVGFILGPGGLTDTEIAHLKADNNHALIIGRGKVYVPPTDILTGIGSIPAAFNITTADIAQEGDAAAASLNVGLITQGAITRANDAYMTMQDNGSLALVANDGIAFGAIAATNLNLAALNQDVPGVAAGDIHLFLGGAGGTTMWRV